MAAKVIQWRKGDPLQPEWVGEIEVEGRKLRVATISLHYSGDRYRVTMLVPGGGKREGQNVPLLQTWAQVRLDAAVGWLIES